MPTPCPGLLTICRCKFLEGNVFDDFVMKITASTADTVTTSQTYTPGVRATGKMAAATVTDSAVWTVKNGKISGVKFTWQDAAGSDALYKHTEVEGIVAAVFASWGGGDYASADAAKAKATADAQWNADAKTDATTGAYTMKNTGGYKVYDGLQGVCDWCVQRQIHLPRLSDLHPPPAEQ